MNVQIYAGKKNFDVQKAERYFKERHIPFASVDLKKHKPGGKEFQLFVRAAGSARALVDPDARGTGADYIHQLSIESVILEVLMENPSLMRTPIVRNGNKVTVGYCPEIWETWAE